MDALASALAADDRANRLYWGSEMSVNQIADALNLSKGALYEMIRPLAADLACPTCGTETVHPNRTAKDRGLVACPSCGWSGEETDAVEALPLPTTPKGAVAARAPAPPAGGPNTTLALALVLGATVGLVVMLWRGRK